MKKIIALSEFIETRLTDEMRTLIERKNEQTYRIIPFSAIKKEERSDIEIAFGFFSREQLDQMPNLLWQQLPSAGAEDAIQNAKGRESLALTNASGAFGVSIAEHILALILEINRGLHRYRDNQTMLLWKDAPYGKLLADSTALIVGLGDIGLEAAKRMKAMGMSVLAIKRTKIEKPDFVDELRFDLGESLDRMIARADYIALCLPNTANTANVIDARRLSMIKDGAAIINIGRGALIDQRALEKELASGRISAGLDVTTPEPLPPDSPLWSFPECVITPHMSGRSDRSMAFITKLFADNLLLFRTGGALKNLVDFTEGY